MSDDLTTMLPTEFEAHLGNLPDDQSRITAIENAFGDRLAAMPEHAQGAWVAATTRIRTAEAQAGREEGIRRHVTRSLAALRDSEDPRVSNVYSKLTPSERDAKRNELLAHAAFEGVAIDETPADPEQIALDRVDRQFGREFSPEIALDIEERATKLEAQGAGAVDGAISALRRELGDVAYNALVERAKAAFPDGDRSWPRAVLADRLALQSFAAYGDYLARGEVARARILNRGKA